MYGTLCREHFRQGKLKKYLMAAHLNSGVGEAMVVEANSDYEALEKFIVMYQSERGLNNVERMLSAGEIEILR